MYFNIILKGCIIYASLLCVVLSDGNKFYIINQITKITKIKLIRQFKIAENYIHLSIHIYVHSG